MTKQKSTKRALFASVLSLLLCVSMLIGSTFAWFTDSAATGVNTIQSGTLDIALEMLVDGEWVNAEGKTLDFIKAEGAEDEEILWEPGCTYKLPDLRIVNNGNLHLKYMLTITGIDGDAKLNEAIVWTYGDYEVGTEYVALAPKATSKTITIEGHMKEEAGNEYQGLTIDGISITVFATQVEAEYDSYNNIYDQAAPYLEDEEGNILIGDAGALIYFAQQVNVQNNTFSGKTVKLTADIDLAGYNWIPIGSVNSYPSVTFAGTFDGQGHTISNMKATAKGDGGVAAAGLFGSITGEVKNLTVDKATVISSHYAGGIVGYSSANVGMAVTNCKVTNSTITSAPELLDDGSYDNGDKAGGIIGYMVSGDKVENCTVENTTITAYRDLGGIAGYAAGTVTNNTVKNVTLTINAEHNYKGYLTEDEHDAGVIVGEGTADESNTSTDSSVSPYVLTINDANTLKKFAESVNSGKNYAGETVKLSGDIDLAGEEWTPIGYGTSGSTEIAFAGIFDGQGYTISNFTFKPGTEDSEKSRRWGFFTTIAADGVVKNLNLENVSFIGMTRYFDSLGSLAGALYGKVENCHVDSVTIISNTKMTKTGGFVGKAETNAVINKCSVNNVTITCTLDTDNGDLTAGFVGYTASTADNSGVKITDCTASNITLNGNYKTKRWAGFIGYSNFTTLENCTVNNVEINVADYYQSVGGFVGDATNNTHMTNCNVNGAIIDVARVTSGGTVGGFASGTLVTDASYAVNFKNCNVTGLYITADGNVMGSGAVAGFLGTVWTSVNIENCSVEGEINAVAAAHPSSGAVGTVAEFTTNDSGLATNENNTADVRCNYHGVIALQ